MAENACVELIDAAAAEFERAMRELPDDAWELPTPSDVSVRELVQHVVAGNRLTAMLLSGVDREEARTAVSADLLGDDPLAAVAASSLEQAQAFAAAAPEQIVPGPRGPIGAEAFWRFRVVDLVVHAWDLRRGAGVDETLDPDVVHDLLEAVEPHLDEMLSFGAYGDGPSGTVPTDAPEQLRLLDAFGRRP